MFAFSDGTVDPLQKALMKQADAPIPHIMNGWLDACHPIATYLIASLSDVMRKGYLAHYCTGTKAVLQRHKAGSIGNPMFPDAAKRAYVCVLSPVEPPVESNGHSVCQQCRIG